MVKDGHGERSVATTLPMAAVRLRRSASTRRARRERDAAAAGSVDGVHVPGVVRAPVAPVRLQVPFDQVAEASGGQTLVQVLEPAADRGEAVLGHAVVADHLAVQQMLTGNDGDAGRDDGFAVDGRTGLRFVHLVVRILRDRQHRERVGRKLIDLPVATLVDDDRHHLEVVDVLTPHEGDLGGDRLLQAGEHHGHRLLLDVTGEVTDGRGLDVVDLGHTVVVRLVVLGLLDAAADRQQQSEPRHEQGEQRVNARHHAYLLSLAVS